VFLLIFYMLFDSIFLLNSEGSRPLGRPRNRWEDIRVDLQEVGYRGMDWIGLAQDRYRWRALVNVVMNFWVPKMWGIS
jgi:hypothetical protein